MKIRLKTKTIVYTPGMLEWLFVAALCAVLAQNAFAADVKLQWTLPGIDCDGAPQTATELEFFVADTPIPAGDDEPCPPSPVPADYEVDPRPVGSNIVLTANSTNTTTGELDIQLLGGQTYYVRARLRDANGEWSNLSPNLELVVDKGILRPPAIIRLSL